MWRVILLALITSILFFGCNPKYGFIESEFTLADESRLPRFVEVPYGYSRSDLTITIIHYLQQSGIKARIIVRGPAPDRKVLVDKIGPKRMHPLTEQQGYYKYPLYSIVSIDGIEEIFEQRQPEPFLFITDNPELRKVLNNTIK